MTQIPYPDVSKPKSLIKTFFKAWELQDKQALEQCIFPKKNADIFLRDGKKKGWESIRFIEVQKLGKPIPAGFQSKTMSTHRVIVTLRHLWDSEELEDVPYSYFIRKIKGKWQIVSWTIELDYGS